MAVNSYNQTIGCCGFASKKFDGMDEESWREEKEEFDLGVESNTLDYGQDDYVDVSTDEGYQALCEIFRSREVNCVANLTCFEVLCNAFGVKAPRGAKSCEQLAPGQLALLSESKEFNVAIDLYALDDFRNHVVAVSTKDKTGTINYSVPGSESMTRVTKCVTTPQEFFNKGGRFYLPSFYADESTTANPGLTHPEGMADFGGSFGSDRRGPASYGYGGSAPPPPPESVSNEDSRGGAANVTGGVVRSKRRVVKSKGAYDNDVGSLRGYAVVGTTMFNNVDEVYLDTISREYAQEIMEELFRVWGLPTEDPMAMQYAEDLVWLFIVARTASNKANYDAEFEVPTKDGSVVVNFSKFSMLLADKYGLTRRNFSRGVANDIRAYLMRPENQFVRSRSAQRVNADPQYGQLCFDGSTGCTNMVSSDVTFCRVLEARNLYERDDVIAEGASDKLMQGIHGGVRSKVAR